MLSEPPSSRDTMRPRFSISLWCFFLGVLIWLGVRTLSDQMPGLAHRARGPWATCDISLNNLLIPEPSETVRSALAKLPYKGGILFVGPRKDPRFMLTFYVVNYLAWPHEVGYVGCNDPGVPPEVTTLPRKDVEIKSVIYYRSTPPAWLPPGKSLGPRMTLVPILEIREWKQYCSP